jgi:hypothetical protein
MPSSLNQKTLAINYSRIGWSSIMVWSFLFIEIYSLGGCNIVSEFSSSLGTKCLLPYVLARTDIWTIIGGILICAGGIYVLRLRISH